MIYDDNTVRAERPLNFEDDLYFHIFESVPTESIVTLDPALIIEQLQSNEETNYV
tara:strand:+ start:1399 stop:1563 length:165 start_codon:yes stop_codon:yes gene_type:complete